jgi:glycosyltransferase involved in cell wall biosynthesis
MNLLLISEVNLPTVSGVATSTDTIARFIASRGHHVYLVCPRPVVPYVSPPQEGLEIIYTPSFRDPFFVGKPMAIIPIGLWEIWHTIQTHHIDVVHIQEPGSLGIMALVLSKLYHLPVVGAMHFSLEQIVRITSAIFRPISEPFMKAYIRLVYPRYTAIMMPTKTVIKELSAFMGHAERMHAVSNGVNTTVYAPIKGSYASLRKKYHLHPTNPYFIYIGRFDADKNIETILKAMPLLSTDIRLILTGVGKQKENLVGLAKTLKIMDRITWIDQVSRNEIVDLYQLSDGFVIMSPVETQSIVALQAIACGLPVIAADAGALPELVHDGENGYLLPTFDEKLLAEKISYLATHPKERERMGKKSREMSLKHYTPVVLAQLEKLYLDVIDQQKHSK